MNLQSKEENMNSLRQILLSTLDERVFFSELAKFLKCLLNVDRALVYQVLEDNSGELIVQDGDSSVSIPTHIQGEGAFGQVFRTQRPYFSNSVKRDPLYSNQKSELDFFGEVVLPIIHEGVFIAILHLQTRNEIQKFSLKEINLILEIINELSTPISNIKLYLAAKSLNQELMKKIEKKERELFQKEGGGKISDNFKISDPDLLGNSPKLVELVKLADKMAHSTMGLLIQGEMGTGRECLARRIHCQGPRKEGPFVSLDCSALNQENLTSEIFGEEIIYPLDTVKPGVIELAHGGTLYLKGITYLGPDLQLKLKHFIKEGMAFRVNGRNPFRSDVRIIVSTTKDIEQDLKSGMFREDLFFLLSTINFKVPPLRERVEDIEILVNHFLNKGRPVEFHKSIAPNVLKKLSLYDWPGNLRELQNVLERAYIYSDGPIIEIRHFSGLIGEVSEVQEQEEQNEEGPQEDFVEMSLEELERHHICKTLKHLNGNKTKTARSLGITVKTLYNKLHNYEVMGHLES